jgi:hypothetical protein
LDETILKPLLIYKYDRKRMENDDEYNEFINEYGNIIGSIINVAEQ